MIKFVKDRSLLQYKNKFTPYFCEPETGNLSDIDINITIISHLMNIDLKKMHPCSERILLLLFEMTKVKGTKKRIEVGG